MIKIIIRLMPEYQISNDAIPKSNAINNNCIVSDYVCLTVRLFFHGLHNRIQSGSTSARTASSPDIPINIRLRFDPRTVMRYPSHPSRDPPTTVIFLPYMSGVISSGKKYVGDNEELAIFMKHSISLKGTVIGLRKELPIPYRYCKVGVLSTMGSSCSRVDFTNNRSAITGTKTFSFLPLTLEICHSRGVNTSKPQSSSIL